MFLIPLSFPGDKWEEWDRPGSMCSAVCLPGRALLPCRPEPPVQAPGAMQGVGAAGEGALHVSG